MFFLHDELLSIPRFVLLWVAKYAVVLEYTAQIMPTDRGVREKDEKVNIIWWLPRRTGTIAPESAVGVSGDMPVRYISLVTYI